MKNLNLLLLTSDLAMNVATAGQNHIAIKALDVSFVDSSWDGNAVPIGQQCQKYGGKAPSTPRLRVSDLPKGTTAIVMEYSDRAYKPMDNGGHGKLGYKVAENTSEVIVPSVAGHTFDLPTDFFSVAAHRGPDWDKAGAYMPPCSGGNNHPYHVTVKAVQQTSEKMMVLAQTQLEMGIY